MKANVYLVSVVIFFLIIVGLYTLDKTLFFIIFMILTGITLLVAGFMRLYQKKVIDNLPLSKIRSLSMGLVKIHGKVLTRKKLVVSPLNKKKCVYYTCTVEEYRSQGKNSSWVTIFQSTESVPFYIEDQTGKVLVDLKGANVNIKKDSSLSSGLFKKIPPEFENFLVNVGIRSRTLFNTNKTMRFREDFLLPGDQIYIVGTAGHSSHEQMESVKRVNVYQVTSVLRNMQAGGINPTVPFMRKYQPEIVEIENKTTFKETLNELDNTTIKRGYGIFLVSDKEEQIILRNMALEVALLMIIGAMLTIGGLTGILIYFGIV